MANNKFSKSKSLGKLIGFFFGIVGLFAGLLYPESSEERSDFIDGWRTGFELILTIAISALALVFLISLAI